MAYQIHSIAFYFLVPPHREAYKWMVKTHIINYWTTKLSNLAANKPSLALLKTPSLSLGAGPHPVWSTCWVPQHVRIAAIQAKFMVGTYGSYYHTRH